MGPRLSDADCEFLISAAAHDAQDKDSIRRALHEDTGLRAAMTGDGRVFARVMADNELFLKVSPALYFEVLVRRAIMDIGETGYTLERTGSQSIPVFDTPEVIEVLRGPGVAEYLATMLASFTRIRSYTVPVRIRRGIRRRLRYNDMDVDSLIRLCSTTEDSQRFGLYKRIADVCLFVTGIFPGHAFRSHRRPRDTSRPQSLLRSLRTLEEYEVEGRRFYRLAAEHPVSRTLEMTDMFSLLREHFDAVSKPLVLLSTRYLHSRRDRLFGMAG